MPDTSANLSLPLLAPSQAQKHVTHNEALQALDALVQLTVLDRTLTAPPADPAEGDRYLVPAGGGSGWAGAAGTVAAYQNGGWIYYPPMPGWRAFVLADRGDLIWRDGAWRDSADLAISAATLGINATADATNRLSLSAPATLLNHEGAGHQLKINKAGVADTAALLFQTGFSGRAEIGLAGTDDFAVRVSADGSGFVTALEAAAGDGAVRLPQGALLPDGTAATPALRFAADPDTGLYRIAGDRIGISTGGVQRAALSATALTLDLPVNGAAVTQTMTDTTAGRLTKVGDFGLGASAIAGNTPPGDDLDNAAITGWFDIAATTANSPLGGETGVCLVVARSAGRIHQTVNRLAGGAAPEIWHRQSHAAGPLLWGPWTRTVQQQNLLGPVSQSGGLPTGAVIEQGLNASGTYRRLACGTQICWHTINAFSNATTASGSLFVGSEGTWSFPAAFTLPPTTSGNVRSSAPAWLNVRPGGTTSALARVLSPVSQSSLLIVDLMAVGRWF